MIAASTAAEMEAARIISVVDDVSVVDTDGSVVDTDGSVVDTAEKHRNIVYS